MPAAPILPMPAGLALTLSALPPAKSSAASLANARAYGASAELYAESDAELALSLGASLVLKISESAFVTSLGDLGPESP